MKRRQTPFYVKTKETNRVTLQEKFWTTRAQWNTIRAPNIYQSIFGTCSSNGSKEPRKKELKVSWTRNFVFIFNVSSLSARRSSFLRYIYFFIKKSIKIVWKIIKFDSFFYRFGLCRSQWWSLCMEIRSPMLGPLLHGTTHSGSREDCHSKSLIASLGRGWLSLWMSSLKVSLDAILLLRILGFSRRRLLGEKFYHSWKSLWEITL